MEQISTPEKPEVEVREEGEQLVNSQSQLSICLGGAI
jgi:hypothetical protein